MIVDGHTHSTFSPDSGATIQSIANSAVQRGLRGVVVADHNTTVHLDHLDSIRAAGLETLEAIEWATEIGGRSIHLLCYAKRFDRVKLEPLLATTRGDLTKRTLALAQAVERATTMDIDLSVLLEARRVSSYLRRHDVIEALMKSTGHDEPTAKTAVKQIDRGLSKAELTVAADTILATVHDAGGVAVLAHPGAHLRTGLEPLEHRAWVEQQLAELISLGLAGLEVRSVWHDSLATAWATDLAQQHGLLTTAGSDWHGGRWPGEVPVGTNGLDDHEWHALTTSIEQRST